MFPYNDTFIKKKEEKDYALKCAISISSMSYNNKIETQKEHYKKNIQYIEALQSNESYTKHLNKNFDILGISNLDIREDINSSPLGIIKLIYKSIYSRIDKINTEICVEGKDVQTLKERDMYLKDIRNRKKLAPIIQDITGIDPSYEVKDITDEDIEMLETLGVPTLYEVLYERLLKTTDEYNELKTDIIPYINNAIICAGFCGTHLYYDSAGMIIEEQILPNSIKVVGGTKQDYSDADCFIITKKINYNELLSYYIKEPLTKEQTDILKTIKDKDGNICVDIIYWSALSFIPKKTIKDEDGEIIGVRQHGVKHKAEYVITIHNWYSCFYIKEINFVFNYGSVKNMPRKKGKNGNILAYCPVTLINTSVVYESDSSPIISVITKFEDMANIAYNKLQNEIANARASGYNINLASLNDAMSMLKDENISLKHADLIKLKLKTGIGIASHKDDFDNPTSQQAFTYEEGGLSKAYSEYVSVINMAIDWCYMFSGTPRVDTGVEQDYKISNYVTAGIMEGADKAVVDLIKAKDLYLLKSAEKKLNMIINIYDMDYKENPYKSILNELENDYLKNIDMSTRQLFIKLEKAYTEQEEKQLRAQADLALQSYMQSGGVQGMSQQEYLVFNEMFKENKKMANIKLVVVMNRREKQKLAQSEQMQQQNAILQQQSNDQSATNEMMLIKAKAEEEKNKKDLELRNKSVELMVKSNIEKGVSSEEILALVYSAIQSLEQNVLQPNEQQSDNLPDAQIQEEQGLAI
jgi:hypothetical protein